MNLVEATVEDGEARFGACRLALPAPARALPERVILGLRPHDLELAGPGDGSAPGRGSRAGRGRRGARHRDAARGRHRRAARCAPTRCATRSTPRPATTSCWPTTTARRSPRSSTRACARRRRATVELTIDPARLHAFDPDTGAAIELDGAPVDRARARVIVPAPARLGPDDPLGPRATGSTSAAARRGSRPRPTRAASTPSRRCARLPPPASRPTSRSPTARASPGAARCSTSRATSSASTTSAGVIDHLARVQAQRAAPAPDRRPGLAARDRRLAAARRARRQHRGRRRRPAASTRRTTTGEIVALRRRAVRHRRAGDRHARATSSAALASYPELNGDGHGASSTPGTEVGFSSLDVHAERHLPLPRRRARRARRAHARRRTCTSAATRRTARQPRGLPRVHASACSRSSPRTASGWSAGRRSPSAPLRRRRGRPVLEHDDAARPRPRARGRASRARSSCMSPADRVYLDMKYDADTPLGLDWAGHVEVRDSYDWDPGDAGRRRAARRRSSASRRRCGPRR